MDSIDELIDIYGYSAEIYSKGYSMMGRLLDRDFVRSEVEKRHLSKLYIYGGGYLGIQLYRAIQPFADVVSVIDKRGKLRINIDDIPVMDMNAFCKSYRGEVVIITPIQHYREIHSELKEMVAEHDMIFLEEFGGV